MKNVQQENIFTKIICLVLNEEVKCVFPASRANPKQFSRENTMLLHRGLNVVSGFRSNIFHDKEEQNFCTRDYLFFRYHYV